VRSVTPSGKQNSESGADLVSVARVVKTKGLKGELVADLLTDFPERFANLSTLTCVAQNGSRQAVVLESFSFQRHRIVLKLAGVDDIDSAAEFVGCEFAVPESERVQLPEGEFYDWELEGCAVKTIAGKAVGQVRGVLKTGGVDALIVENAERRECLVPLAAAIVTRIDLVNKSISIDPPEGLLEL
jgi:16S rRNA processing protein RimM